MDGRSRSNFPAQFDLFISGDGDGDGDGDEDGDLDVPRWRE
jgi:hypothetical protein